MIDVGVSKTSLKQLDEMKRVLYKVENTLLTQRDKPHERIKNKQAERWTENFRKEGAIYGQWAALSPYTISQRVGLGYPPGPILFRSGLIFTSFARQNKAGRVSPFGIIWQFENEPPAYPAFHHRGGYIRSKSGHVSIVPPRILWETDEQDAKNAHDIMEKWVDSIINRYF